MDTYTDALIYATGWTVIHSLWQAFAIALGLSILLIITPRRLAHWRYGCAGIALLLVLLAGGATFHYYYHQALARVAALPLPLNQTLSEINPSSNFWQEWQSLFTIYFNQHMPLIVTIWLCGLTFFMLRMLGGLAYVQQLRYHGTLPVQTEWEEILHELSQKLSIKRPVGLMESRRIHTPVVIGHFKPLILVPVGLLAGLNIEQIEAILAHELAHVYRRDYLLNILQTLIEIIFYFNPGVWWISTCIRIEREHCCDDIVVNLCQNNLEYAKALVSIKEMNRGHAPQMAMAAMSKKKLLLTRIQRILQQPVNTSDMSEKIMVTAMLAFTLICINVKAERKVPVPIQTKSSVSKIELSSKSLPAMPTDTLPEGKITIRTNRDGKKIEAKLLDRKIQELIVDGKTIPATEYNNYEETLQDIIASVPPPPPPPATPFPMMAPEVPDAPGSPGVPPPPPPGQGRYKPHAPLPPAAPRSGYYYYNSGDNQIIIETPSNRDGSVYKYRSPGFKYEFNEAPAGFERSFIFNGMDSMEVSRFNSSDFQFQGFNNFNFSRLDSLRVRIDTGQLRRLKMELGQMGHLKEKLRDRIQKLGHRFDGNQFPVEVPRINVHPEQFQFEMRAPEMIYSRDRLSTRDKLEQTMVSDELIKAKNRYTFELTDKYLKIDGKKMPEALFEKYRKLYEEGTGIRLETESKVLLSH